MKTTIITLALALAGSGLQATEPPPTITITDKFNAATLDPATWYLSDKGNGRLAVMNGKLNFLVGANAGKNVLGAAELICQYPGFDEEWELTVALSNNFAPGKKAGCGVMICHAEDRSDYFYLDFKGLSGISSGMYANGRKLDGFFYRKSSWAKARLRIQYADKVMKFSISPTGKPDSWLNIGKFSPTARKEGIPAQLHANWRMKPSDTFGIQLYGFSNSTRVRAGKTTLDNFQLIVTP